MTWATAKGGNIKKGDIAGCLNKRTGYYVVRLDYKLYQAHRLVWLLNNQTIDRKLVIDHIDGNKTNNSILNLRQTTKSANGYNRKENSRDTGVYWRETCHGKEAITYHILDGKRKARSFSVNKYGEDLAWEMACQVRTATQEKMKEFYGL